MFSCTRILRNSTVLGPANPPPFFLRHHPHMLAKTHLLATLTVLMQHCTSLLFLHSHELNTFCFLSSDVSEHLEKLIKYELDHGSGKRKGKRKLQEARKHTPHVGRGTACPYRKPRTIETWPIISHLVREGRKKT